MSSDSKVVEMFLFAWDIPDFRKAAPPTLVSGTRVPTSDRRVQAVDSDASVLI